MVKIFFLSFTFSQKETKFTIFEEDEVVLFNK